MTVGPSQLQPRDNDTLEQASEWFVRLRNDDAEPHVWQQFCRWRDSSDANANAFREVQTLWESLDYVEDHPEMARFRIDALARVPARRTRWQSHAVALAASLILLLVPAIGLYRWTDFYPNTPAVEIADATVGRSVGSLAETTRKTEALEAFQNLSFRYRTAVGQRANFTLPDGSRLELNTDSLVSVDYSGKNRNLRLVRGEAVFVVARDPKRPFSVAVGNERVVALGTVFSVRKDSQSVQVTLLEGKVRVERGEGANAVSVAQLTAGEQVVVGPSLPIEISRADVTRAASWRSGRLIFDNQPLNDVIMEINRYSDTKLRIGDPSIESLKISATLRIGSADKFADALAASFPVRLATQRNGEIVVMPIDPALPRDSAPLP
jgi:transmembrane sensor